MQSLPMLFCTIFIRLVLVFVVAGMVNAAGIQRLLAQQTQPTKKTVPKPLPKPLLERKETFTPQEIITADTASKRREADTSGSVGTTTPGEYPFTSDQDRSFYSAVQSGIPASVRFAHELRRLSPTWLALKEQLKSMSPLEAAIANINAIPPSMLKPTAQEQTAYDYAIAQSFTVPGVYEPFNRGGGIGKGGVQIPLSLIGALLGLIEDVSPSLSFNVEQPSEVEVIIYSVQAIAVAHIFKSHQQPGKYSTTWNLLNDQGQRVARGDYIGEIRVGTENITRKRIRID
jgi:hypothetical protein